ncbi:MAG TPA: hypothetical protein VF733_03310 [Candidatus Saccharimonadales bacterium]
METSPAGEQKPKRLYFKTYLHLIQNSVGSEMFRNFYIQTSDGQEMDALADGSNSCAFYVSSVLTLFKKHSGVHGTVKSVIADLDRSGWQRIEEGAMMPGDVILWTAVELEGKWYEHVGFYVGDNRAISTSWTEKRVIEHDVYFDGARTIGQVFRHNNWR